MKNEQCNNEIQNQAAKKNNLFNLESSELKETWDITVHRLMCNCNQKSKPAQLQECAKTCSNQECEEQCKGSTEREAWSGGVCVAQSEREVVLRGNEKNFA